MASSTLLLLARGVGFIALTCGLVLLHLLIGWIGPGVRFALRRAWCRGCCRLMGVSVARAGVPETRLPTLYVANHVSYLDVPVLGAALDATFVGKSEVEGWPLFGFLGKLTNTLFVRRHWRDAAVQRDALLARMQAGESFVLFAEGTSTDGLDVLPFKTSLLSAVEAKTAGREVAVQPVSLAFRRHADGNRVTPANAGLYAWYGDDELLPHLTRALRGPGVEVELLFGRPVRSTEVASRKLLGPELREAVRAHVRRVG